MTKHKIEDILNRRDDLSTFVVHLTKDLVSLKSILDDRLLKASSSYGDNPIDPDPAWEPPPVVCMSEAPLAQLWSLCSAIEGRSHEFGPYGLVFSRNWARSQGCNPVFYSDMAGTTEAIWPTRMLNKIYASCDSEGRQALASYTRFIEPMGARKTVREWWWEREWRHLGDLTVDVDHLVAVLCAEQDRGDVDLRRTDGRSVPVLDPRWGLEPMLLALSGAEPTPWPFPSSKPLVQSYLTQVLPFDDEASA